MNTGNSKLQRFLKSLGPGILFAGAAIGGSHLIQSTRAGANYGFNLILLIIMINFLKYPFFEFGQRYTAATQQNLLVGYGTLGRWVLYLYLFLTLVTAFPTVAAVSFINANIATYIIGATISPLVVSIGLLGICVYDMNWSLRCSTYMFPLHPSSNPFDHPVAIRRRSSSSVGGS